MVTVILKEGLPFDTTEDNIVNIERLFGDNIKDIKYQTTPLSDKVNALAAAQAAMWGKQENGNSVAKKTGRPKGAKNK